MTKQEIRLFHAQVILECFRDACEDLMGDETKLVKYLDEFGEKLGYLCVKKMAEKAGLSIAEVEMLTKVNGFWMRDMTFVPPEDALRESSNLARFVSRHKIGGLMPTSLLVILTTLF